MPAQPIMHDQGDAMFEFVDQNPDGKLGEHEINNATDIKQFDRNSDGYADAYEATAAEGARSPIVKR